jgi:site-specific DNA-methyltransferase (adenine-specific)
MGNFLNEIIWNYGNRATPASSYFCRKHDNIYLYCKSKHYTFNPIKQPHKESSLKRADKVDEDGRVFEYKKRKRTDGTIYYGKTYLNPEGAPIPSVWDMPSISSTAKERIGYPTQKPEALLERIIKASSNEGDVVLDAFCGGGTTVAVADRLNRKWIGIDQSVQAIKVSEARLYNQR